MNSFCHDHLSLQPRHLHLRRLRDRAAGKGFSQIIRFWVVDNDGYDANICGILVSNSDKMMQY